MLESIGDTTTTKTMNNIKKALHDNLVNKYNIENGNIVDKILEIHGINKNNFDFISSVETVINEHLNDTSIDDNSNKNEKTIEGIFSEVVAPIKKAVGYDYLFRTMRSLYGRTEAKRLIGEMMDFSLALSDSTNILKNYCYAIDASKIITIGRDFGVLHSKPSKRLTSYISALCETIHQMSSHMAGAIAIGSLFLDVAHILMKEGRTLQQLKDDCEIRKYVENEFQQLVHSVNHLSRNAQESPFTNISIFDTAKLKTLVDDYKWYFVEFNEGESKKDQQQWNDYIIQYITECQNIFLDFFDKGDPSKGGAPYRFPLVTINISKKKWGDKWILEDNDFIRSVCKREIFRYNIFTSEGTKISSCCRLINDVEMMGLAAQANSFGGASISLGSHRVVTINFMRIALEAKNEKDFYEILEERLADAAKILKAHKELIKVLTEKNLQQFVSNGWINLNRLFSTFGILGVYEASILYKEKFKKRKDIIKEILEFMNERVSKLSKEYGIIGNIEQIPAESMAKRLPIVDKLLFGEKQIPYILYANQFVPLWEDSSIWNKFDVDGKYNQLITGGGIVHGTIGEKVTSKQAEKLIKYAIDSGCEHFALNMIYSECLSGHVTHGKHENCPTCGEKIIEYYTRVVGFFTPVNSWNKERREWEFPRRHIHDKELIEAKDNTE